MPSHHLISLARSDYGPCVGITRVERWETAQALGLNPPKEVCTFTIFLSKVILKIYVTTGLWYSQHKTGVYFTQVFGVCVSWRSLVSNWDFSLSVTFSLYCLPEHWVLARYCAFIWFLSFVLKPYNISSLLFSYLNFDGRDLRPLRGFFSNYTYLSSSTYP